MTGGHGSETFVLACVLLMGFLLFGVEELDQERMSCGVNRLHMV